MKTNSPATLRRMAISAAAIALAMVTNAYGQAFSGLYSQPLIGSISAAPNILLTMQRDARLFVEAYDDASDINGDGVIDTKYNPALYQYNPATGAYTTNLLDYFGYFDSYKCYEYKTYAYGSGGTAGTVSAFVPIGDTDNGAKTCTGYAKDASGLTKPWSGDFLNYLTTTRIDAMRKVLYGGKRTLTVPMSMQRKLRTRSSKGPIYLRTSTLLARNTTALRPMATKYQTSHRCRSLQPENAIFSPTSPWVRQLTGMLQ